MCKYNCSRFYCLYADRFEVDLVGCFTITYILSEAEYCNNVFYTEGGMVLLELVGFLVLISKYFALMLLAFCTVIGVLNNMLYLVILGGLLLVIFVVRILIGSLTNMCVPFVIIQLSYSGRVIFLVIMVVLLVI